MRPPTDGVVGAARWLSGDVQLEVHPPVRRLVAPADDEHIEARGVGRRDQQAQRQRARPDLDMQHRSDGYKRTRGIAGRDIVPGATAGSAPVEMLGDAQTDLRTEQVVAVGSEQPQA